MSFYRIETGPASLDLSIVVPVFDEEPNVEALAAEISGAMENSRWTWECVWVDDRSSDGTFDKVRALHAADRRHRGVRLAAHGGQSAALAAGISASRGRLVATLDGDGQSDPADIPPLVDLLEREDLHVVNGKREKRRDDAIRRLSSRIANSFRNAVTGDRVTDVGCSVRVFRREAVDGVFVFKGMHRFLPTLIRWNGYGRIVEVPVRHRPRRYGKTKYGVSNRLWVGIADTLAVRWMKSRMASPRIGEITGETTSAEPDETHVGDAGTFRSSRE